MSSTLTPLYISPVQWQPHSDGLGHCPDQQTPITTMDFSLRRFNPGLQVMLQYLLGKK